MRSRFGGLKLNMKLIWAFCETANLLEYLQITCNSSVSQDDSVREVLPLLCNSLAVWSFIFFFLPLFGAVKLQRRLVHSQRMYKVKWAEWRGCTYPDNWTFLFHLNHLLQESSLTLSQPNLLGHFAHRKWETHCKSSYAIVVTFEKCDKVKWHFT